MFEFSLFLFELFLKNELEEITEKLSEMIARPYLRTPKAVIVQTSTLTRRKRHELVRAVSQGLIPPETPPTLRKRKRKFVSTFSFKFFHKVTFLLQDDLADTSIWLKECDWPGGDYDTDEETDLSVTLKKMIRSPVGEHECGLLCSSQGCGTSRCFCFFCLHSLLHFFHIQDPIIT